MRGEIFDGLSDLVLMVGCAVCSHLGLKVEADCSLVAPLCIGSLLTAWNMRGVGIIAQVMGGSKYACMAFCSYLCVPCNVSCDMHCILCVLVHVLGYG
jgi:hypothetical protein